jgi:glycosyltransferase involved in cell wall biosynthesis
LGFGSGAILLTIEGAFDLRLSRILALGTYPIEKPIHGGQRRVAAFKRFYERHGIEYVYACIYNHLHYKGDEVGPNDWPLKIPSFDGGLVYVIGDLMSGRQFETDSVSLQHFASLIERIKPDALQLEQPFMWPMAKQLIELYSAQDIKLIYSSQNVEAPLKREILLARRMVTEKREQICADIEKMETELVREADLIFCVTQDDRARYLQMKSSDRVIIVPNGTDRPPQGSQHRTTLPIQSHFQGRRFLMSVGSSHPPNVDGMCHFVFDNGAFFVPPVKSIAICGGVSEPVFNHFAYQKFLAAHFARAQFFPQIEDAELWAIKHACHGVFLPLRSGGGSNLKTGEALALGKWVIATTVALRGYESMRSAKGLIIADDPSSFRRAMAETLSRPGFQLSEADWAARDGLFWDRCFADSQISRLFNVEKAIFSLTN